MAQYEVPQFIEREARILGPLTIRQLLFFAIVGGIVFLLYFYLQLLLVVIVGVILVIAALVLSFLEVNGRPLSSFLFSIVGFFLNPHSYESAAGEKRVHELSAEEVQRIADMLDRQQ
jgi:membrane-bound ClpP family serine protease